MLRHALIESCADESQSLNRLRAARLAFGPFQIRL